MISVEFHLIVRNSIVNMLLYILWLFFVFPNKSLLNFVIITFTYMNLIVYSHFNSSDSLKADCGPQIDDACVRYRLADFPLLEIHEKPLWDISATLLRNNLI